MRARCMRLVVAAGRRETESLLGVKMRHSSLVRVDLESDGMPVQVMAAFGALPARIDAWALTRGRTTLTSMAPGRLVAGAVKRMSSSARIVDHVVCDHELGCLTATAERRRASLVSQPPASAPWALRRAG